MGLLQAVHFNPRYLESPVSNGEGLRSWILTELQVAGSGTAERQHTQAPIGCKPISGKGMFTYIT